MFASKSVAKITKNLGAMVDQLRDYAEERNQEYRNLMIKRDQIEEQAEAAVDEAEKALVAAANIDSLLGA